MMRIIAFITIGISLGCAPCVLNGAQGITVPNGTVGRNLQTFGFVRLPEVSDAGVQLTLTSDDPSRLLLSTAPDKAGSPVISIAVPAHHKQSADFYLQGLADSGTVTYTVSAGSIGTAKGTVTLAPSAILILGPAKSSRYRTTPRGRDVRVTIVSAALDASLKVVGEQPVAGGRQLEVTVASSNPAAGKLASSKLTLGGGMSGSAVTSFTPAAEGDTSLAPVQPAGFTVPAQYASFTVAVARPGLSAVGEIYVGKDLQTSAALVLGEPAPEGGLKVTLTCADASKLLLSNKEDEVGSASITIAIPAGQSSAPYYIQALGGTGITTYTAEAPGYRSSTARIGLAPSGFIVGYEAYGPPPEANVRDKGGSPATREFYVSLADKTQQAVGLAIWSVRLDPETGRAADITVQPLRAGVTTMVKLESSNPAVGTVEPSPLKFPSGVAKIKTTFAPVSKGKTVITINQPPGFATPQNATVVPATVSE
jgi:hypothetical protein